jgi:hypothetical protein
LEKSKFMNTIGTFLPPDCPLWSTTICIISDSQQNC